MPSTNRSPSGEPGSISRTEYPVHQRAYYVFLGLEAIASRLNPGLIDCLEWKWCPSVSQEDSRRFTWEGKPSLCFVFTQTFYIRASELRRVVIFLPSARKHRTTRWTIKSTQNRYVCTAVCRIHIMADGIIFYSSMHSPPPAKATMEGYFIQEGGQSFGRECFPSDRGK